MTTEDTGLQPVGYIPEDEPVEAPVEKKRPTGARRLVGLALLALLLVVAVIVLAPNLVNRPSRHSAARSAPAAAPASPEPLPTVPVLWDRLDFGAMPAGAAQDLKSGKYYYDKRLPGNFGLAIESWKHAQAALGEVDDGVRRLVVAAERELAGQYSRDSGDAFVMLKQGRRAQAIMLLEKMRADFPDVTAKQYVWASVMLSRHRR